MSNDLDGYLETIINHSPLSAPSFEKQPRRRLISRDSQHYSSFQQHHHKLIQTSIHQHRSKFHNLLLYQPRVPRQSLFVQLVAAIVSRHTCIQLLLDDRTHLKAYLESSTPWILRTTTMEMLILLAQTADRIVVAQAIQHPCHDASAYTARQWQERQENKAFRIPSHTPQPIQELPIGLHSPTYDQHLAYRQFAQDSKQPGRRLKLIDAS